MTFNTIRLQPMLRLIATLLALVRCFIALGLFGWHAATHAQPPAASATSAAQPIVVSANPDTGTVAVASTLGKLRTNELRSRAIDLNFVDADTALIALRALGFNALGGEAGGDEGNDGTGGGGGGSSNRPSGRSNPPAISVPRMVAREDLPMIVRLNATESRVANGIDDGTRSSGGRDSNTLVTSAQASAVQFPAVVGGKSSRLIIMTAHDDDASYERVRKVLDELIDSPAPQVFIEAMLIDISSDALKDLGVRWDIKKGQQTYAIGAATALSPGAAALSIVRDTLTNVMPTQILSKLSALAESNQAEILGRPSILTLDNRQATFRVGIDIPVATSKDAGGGSNSSRVSFTFQYVPVGATLNVRPRVALSRNEVTLAVDANVSATVPNADLRVLDPATNAVLASAPAISQRKIQTYARIKTGETLIIAGLINRVETVGAEKVPGLGDIPVAGKLFGHESSVRSKREIIVVLTPTIITDELPATLRYDMSKIKK